MFKEVDNLGNFWMLAVVLFIASACSKPERPSGPIDPGGGGALNRYDLVDYQIARGVSPLLPAPAFIFSYDASGKASNVFIKLGSIQDGQNLSYGSNEFLERITSGATTQRLSYNGGSKPSRIDYTTLVDTGKVLYSYDPSGRVVSLLDSVKRQSGLVVKVLYEITYNDAGNATVIRQNQLDNANKPIKSREYFTYLSYDGNKNPFTTVPFSRSDSLLPAREASLFTLNNVSSIYRTRTFYRNPGDGTVVIIPDTIPLFKAGRAYTYNVGGYPATCSETYQDLQAGYSIVRNFKYTY